MYLSQPSGTGMLFTRFLYFRKKIPLIFIKVIFTPFFVLFLIRYISKQNFHRLCDSSESRQRVDNSVTVNLYKANEFPMFFLLSIIIIASIKNGVVFFEVHIARTVKFHVIGYINSEEMIQEQ